MENKALNTRFQDFIHSYWPSFDVLKGNQVICTDVKLDNIMTVNHRRQPFEVKMIDFGAAISGSEARTGRTLQQQAFR